MNPQPSREEALFSAAVALTNPEQRVAFLDRECAGDPALRARIERLLRANDSADEFLGQPTVAEALAQVAHGREATAVLPVIEKPGDKIGRYKLLQQIGEGGCGVVYMAEQSEPVRRRVALKVIKLGMDTKQVIARFEAERQALAMMDHPNIAKVFDAGATETPVAAGILPAVEPGFQPGGSGAANSSAPASSGQGPGGRMPPSTAGRMPAATVSAGRPYFVMELVRGTKITEFCDRQKLSTRERLDLFIQVCSAIQHAHQKGIIHRDIKPSNVLVTLHDGVPVPKVIDFGIAKATTDQKLTDKTLFTAFEQFLGTPAYMSPEQAEMSGVDIDTRSDIYSLGVLLYELITGRTPFDPAELLRSGVDGIRKTLREQEPVKPSTKLNTLAAVDLTTVANARHADAPRLIHAIKGDLDWVVMKCLEKDRARRYETANGLAADLKRHLDNEPVLARPASAAYKLRKAFRRNKLAFTAAAAVALALILGLTGTTVGLVRAEKQRHAAEAARKLAEHRFESARRFVDDVFQEVEPEFANLIGASKAREALARISLTFVKSLGDPKQSDEAFQTDLAKLYSRLADSLGDPFSDNSLGDYEAALRFANQSLELWRDLARKDPSDFERQRKVGLLEESVAIILGELGRHKEAKPLYESALKISEAHIRLDPNSARARRNLSVSHWQIGQVLQEEGRVKEALDQHFLPYSKAWLERPLARPDDILTAHFCYVAHALVGDALLKLGRADEALVHLEKALEWVKIKLDMAPNNARAVRDRSYALRSIGAAQLALGQIEPGAQGLAEAVRNAEALVARDLANGPSQLELVDSLLAQANGFATQAALPGISPARQAELWQRTLETLARCQKRLDSPDLRQNKVSLERLVKKVMPAISEAQAALAKIVAEAGPVSPVPENGKAEIKQP